MSSRDATGLQETRRKLRHLRQGDAARLRYNGLGGSPPFARRSRPMGEAPTKLSRYVRRRPETTDLYKSVADNLDTFLEHMATTERVLPSFVVKEFERYIDCGILERGFCRVHCGVCGHDRLVAFSCKGSWCPSCGGRRMAEGAAFLVDHVLPQVLVRQWVLSVAKPIRYLLAYDSKLASEAIAIFTGEVFR